MYRNPQSFTADVVDVLCNPCGDLRLRSGASLWLADAADSLEVGNYTRLRSSLDEAIALDNVQIESRTPFSARAVTLVDTRTGDFQQLAPDPWERVVSSDIKLYENSALQPRTFVLPDARFVPDTDAGTEDALDLMQVPSFNPAGTVIISTNTPIQLGGYGVAPQHGAEITAYTDTRIAITIHADDPSYLVLTDAYYPGWVATVNGEPTPVERADVMFRAVRVPQGESEVVFEYRPAWLPLAPLVGGAAWLIVLIAAAALRRSTRFVEV
jgi:hypothetical protein